LVRVVEARARARQLASLTWPADQDRQAEAATAGFVERGASRRQSGLLVRTPELFEAAEALAGAGVGPVSAARPDYVFHADCPILDELAAKLGAS
jgi:ATP phosphoribosyltransferase